MDFRQLFSNTRCYSVVRYVYDEIYDNLNFRRKTLTENSSVLANFIAKNVISSS